MKVNHTLKPIYNKNSQILILGTMPSTESRKNNFYYAHKNNRFWLIMEYLFKINLNNNEEKEKFLLNNHIALWDVCKTCEIKASNDASITNIEVNDLSLILKESNIKCIFCTGKKAYEIYNKYFKFNIPCFCLPSSSSANAIYSLTSLIKKYKLILKYLYS